MLDIRVYDSLVEGGKGFYVLAVRQSVNSTCEFGDKGWYLILKRYSEFYKLHQQLKADSIGVPAETEVSMRRMLPRIPPKRWKLTCDHTNPAFVLYRQQCLDQYIQQVIRLQGFAENKHVHEFICSKNTIYFKKRL